MKHIDDKKLVDIGKRTAQIVEMIRQLTIELNIDHSNGLYAQSEENVEYERPETEDGQHIRVAYEIKLRIEPS